VNNQGDSIKKNIIKKVVINFRMTKTLHTSPHTHMSPTLGRYSLTLEADVS